MNTWFKVFASYNILQYPCDFIHVLIFVTVSKCRKSPKLMNIVIEVSHFPCMNWFNKGGHPSSMYYTPSSIKTCPSSFEVYVCVYVQTTKCMTSMYSLHMNECVRNGSLLVQPTNIHFVHFGLLRRPEFFFIWITIPAHFLASLNTSCNMVRNMSDHLTHVRGVFDELVQGWRLMPGWSHQTFRSALAMKLLASIMLRK